MLYYIGRTYGLYALVIYYFIPYMIFGAWIAIVTHLHHTHPDVPWFRNQGILRGKSAYRV